MNYEIEKKYFVGNINDIFDKLVLDFKTYKIEKKAGFWWTGCSSGMENILDITDPKILKKDVEALKNIGNFIIPLQDFQFVRLRIKNEKDYFVTFKTKVLVDKIEQNTEYEFQLNLDRFKQILFYLHEKLYIFYYNIKKSSVFYDGNIKIELSQLNDLKNAFLEIELTGTDKECLVKRLNDEMLKFKNYSLIEEIKNYVELSRLENRFSLKGKRLNKYSKEALTKLNNILLEINCPKSV